MKLFCVSCLIRNTRQAMSGYIFADDEEEARKIFRQYLPVEHDIVVDEIEQEKGLLTMVTNDRAVLLKYYPKTTDRCTGGTQPCEG